MTQQEAIQALTRLLGEANVLTDAAERRFYSQDVYREGALPCAVIRPGTADEVAHALRILADAKLAVVPRGGGMSYTDGYLPTRTDSVTIDLLRLDRIVEINEDDLYVTVECGATWKALHDVLTARGLRTPYWGPLSGLRSSIGGALSQGSMFLGSGQYGPVAESLLGLDVVLADGSLVRLGSHANARGKPFLRQYGPDLSAPFLSDNGAFGVKTRASFRLIRLPEAQRHLSFQFPNPDALLAAMARMARTGAVSECFAFDPDLQGMRMKRARLTDDVKTLGAVMKAAGGGLTGLRAGAKLVMAGRDFLDESQYSLHVSIDARDESEADARAVLVKAAAGNDAREVENSVPKVMRANPFAEVTSMLGPGGERWVPVHGIAPLSEGAALHASCEAVFARHVESMRTHGIERGYLMGTVAQTGLLLEPVLYWPDERMAFHERVLPADYLAKLAKFPANPAVRAAVAALRDELAANFVRFGAVSFQIGKFYPYQQGLDASSARFLAAFKAMVDPDGRMNPGTLGLR